MKSLQDSNVQLQSSLQITQIDVLDTGDAAFDRAKDQALCLYPDLDLSSIDFFKVVANGHLMDMEEAEPSPTGDPTRKTILLLITSGLWVRIKMKSKLLSFIL